MSDDNEQDVSTAVVMHARSHGETGRDKLFHRLLSILHKDTVAADPIRGDLIQAEGAPAKWTRHGKGTSGQFWKQGASIGDWATLVSTDVSDFVEASQDAVGAALTDTATVDPTYNDAANQMTFDVKKALDQTYLTDVKRIGLGAGFQLPSNKVGGMVNVTGLKITGAANEWYAIKATVGILSTAAADADFQFTVPAGATLAFSTSQFLDAAGAPTLSTGGVPAGTPVTVGGTGANVWVECVGSIFFGANAGDLQLQAQQHTATAETSDFVIQGTNIIAWRISP